MNSNSLSGSKSAHSFKLGGTHDKLRDKIQQLLLKTLGGSAGEVGLVVQLENALFMRHGSANDEYKAQYKDIALNLNDPSNPDLKQQLLSGQVSPEEMAYMDCADMASAALKKKRKDEEKFINDARRTDW
eukprot:CAMPEP_0175166358 /NCGR_PEP_ID=MMETSP0087-20121206/27657_1 /TAXON_ID=136419 /ORGANISM="Unknown Unknown, Strain D1" /LENGTH=129 /DNA_ID=CAMNT_0016455957 /DNA_START=375 /DNA_END=761 /DNA_ORIENTATION=+